MKKIISIMMLCFVCVTLSAQTDTASHRKFLNRYSALIARMKDKYVDNPDSVAAWKLERKNIQNLYKERYKYTFTDDELEEYYSLNTQYKTRVTEMNLNDLSEQLDTIGSRVGKEINRTGKKVSGFLKGLKRQSDSNRKSE